MGRHSFGEVWAAPSQRRAGRRTALAFGVAVLGIILLVVGIISLITTISPDPLSSGATTTSATTSAATESRATTSDPPTTTPAPTETVLLPVTVLNNSAVDGLAALVAGVLEASGWEIAALLNYSDTQVPATTAFYTPGDAAEEAAARAMVAQFPEIVGGAEPRFAGLNGSGLTLAAVGDWVPEP